MALVIETRSSHGSVSRTHLRAGTTRVVVRPGDTFRLYDEDTGKAPAKAVVKQLDNSILVDNLADGAQGADQPQAVELLGFYSSCSVSSPCHLELPETTSGTVDITHRIKVLPKDFQNSLSVRRYSKFFRPMI